MPTEENGLATYTVDIGYPFTISQSWNLADSSVSGNVLTFSEADDQPSQGLVLAFDSASGVSCSGSSFSPSLTATVSATVNGQSISVDVSGATGLQVASASAVLVASVSSAANAGNAATVTEYKTVYITKT
ncbi:hypothetical protein HK405_013346, partial [Cladochytrium tenue]